ncbi:hypothetical protein K457DRAFT_133748 [Linnemannia elongata AG-77]|uniref:Uncharacterized protein n=1 Tax=Linnemannia elongata AG-77 TaxID=1314771 RepID=A0A197KAH7_9FUNG|nr:hypothetical protein K457DRAFT_133748 [Linnemannia elongata AG-77]
MLASVWEPRVQLLFGCGLLSSYLLLFIHFCRLTYNEKAKATKQQWQHCGTDTTPKPVNSGSSGSKKSKSNLTKPMSQKK